MVGGRRSSPRSPARGTRLEGRERIGTGVRPPDSSTSGGTVLSLSGTGYFEALIVFVVVGGCLGRPAMWSGFHVHRTAAHGFSVRYPDSNILPPEDGAIEPVAKRG